MMGRDYSPLPPGEGEYTNEDGWDVFGIGRDEDSVALGVGNEIVALFCLSGRALNTGGGQCYTNALPEKVLDGEPGVLPV
jgi:hypothetical protein